MILDEFVRDRLLEPEVADATKEWHGRSARKFNDQHTNDPWITRESTKSLANFFKKKGWNVLGKGAFSIVLDKPGSDFVIKVSPHNDKGFNRYVLTINHIKNPHFPKITSGRRIQIGNRAYYIYIIEKLKPLPKTKLLKMVTEYLLYTAKQQDPYKTFYGRNKNMEDAVLDFLQTQPELERAAEEIAYTSADVKGNFLIDLHHGNFMQREDGTIVITDPYVQDWTKKNFSL